MESVKVPESNITQLEANFAKLARRAAKLGLTAPKLVKGEIVEQRFAEGYGLGGQKYHTAVANDYVLKPGQSESWRRYVMCTCEGEAPVLDGWSLVSVIDHTTDPEIGNLIKNVPGKETPPEYRKSGPLCQHCNSMRRRHETFLIVKDGEYKQIGRNCLADFCRSPEMAANLVHSAEYLFSAEGLLGDAEGDDYCGGRTERYYPIEGVLTLARRLIRQLGWVSRKEAEERYTTATASWVTSITTWDEWKKNAPRDVIAAFENGCDEDVEIAAQALQWIRDKRAEADTLNDYIYNLLVVCSQERIPVKHFGLACSLISAWMRDQEREIERKLRESRPPSQHFGTVKKREKFTLTVTGLNFFDNEWGLTTFVRFVDDNGNCASWKASGEVDMDIGDKYIVTGTVKEHGEYKGTKQTILTRCKCVKIEVPVLEQEEVAV